MPFLHPPLLDQLNLRLKEARHVLGLRQPELAEAGGVSRTAQVRYESGETSPSFDYLLGIQSTGINIPYVLFGQSSAEIAESAVQSQQKPPIDWATIRQVFEDVEFFCGRFSPNCPPGHRWEMVAEIYLKSQSNLSIYASMDRHARQQAIREIFVESAS
jgi:transcriptional regulator with XRE-family HTH domain